MAIRASTGAINSMLSTSAFKATMEGAAGFLIDIYSGSRPSSPNEAATGTKLVTLSLNGAGNGLHFAAAAVNGVIDKLSTETWSGTCIATGTAGYFRMRKTTDAGTTLDATAIRIDGTVANSGADLNLTNTSLVATEPFNANSAQFTIISSTN